MTCLSCVSYRKQGCEINCDPQAGRAWPLIGDRCLSFDYEPGTGPGEFDSYEEYMRITAGKAE